MKKFFGGKSSKDKRPNGAYPHPGSATPPAPAPAQAQSQQQQQQQQRPANGQTPPPSSSAPAATSMQFTSLAGTLPTTPPGQNGANGANGAGGYPGGYPPVSTPGGAGPAGGGYPPVSSPYGGYPGQQQQYPGMPQPNSHQQGGGGVIPPPSTAIYPPLRQQTNGPLPPPSSNPYQSQPYNPGYMAAAAAQPTHQVPLPQPAGFRANGTRLTGDPKEDYPIVMAIDFGTTFTGCAFAFRKDPEIQEIITW